jgi:ParB family chromosome partitioning protein
VLQAFASPLDLQFRWATAFKAAMEADAAGLEARAAKIAAQRGARTPKEIFAALMASPAETVIGVPAPVQVFERAGTALATLQLDRAGRATIRIHTPLSAARQQELALWVERFVTES